jgi:hypothetical protein
MTEQLSFPGLIDQTSTIRVHRRGGKGGFAHCRCVLGILATLDVSHFRFYITLHRRGAKAAEKSRRRETHGHLPGKDAPIGEGCDPTSESGLRPADSGDLALLTHSLPGMAIRAVDLGQIANVDGMLERFRGGVGRRCCSLLLGKN